MPRYDAVIVGAGPAGSATAAHLAAGGARVLVLDRSTFPRDKACGGGLTPRGVGALQRLGVDIESGDFIRVGGLEMSAGRRSVATSFPSTSRWPSFGLVARRSTLDTRILDRAVQTGAELREGVRVLGPLMEDGVCRGVRVRSNGTNEDVEATVTIAADGATSSIARGTGTAPTASTTGGGFWYTALRGYLAPIVPRTHDGLPVLEFYPLRSASGRWLPAYGWVFPLPDGSANVGVDIPHRPHLDSCPPLRDAYTSFIEQLRRERPGFESAAEEAPPVGALLPEAMRGFRPGSAGMLAVGDAAGLISPYSGEGIAYALEGAELAAAAVLSGASATETLRTYERVLWDAYGFQFRWALSFMKAMRRPGLALLAATLGLRSARVLRAAVRIMAYLIEDDPTAPASTVSRGYLRARRLLPSRPAGLWG